jgi:6-phosphogluconolactonase
MTPLEVAVDVADAFSALVHGTLARRPRFACAVPGGSVATMVLPVVASRALPWAAVDLFLADERFVDPSAPESNARVVREQWPGTPSATGPALHPMPTSGDPDDAARLASEELVRWLGAPPRFDLVILGVGPDGHVASLFPGGAWPGRTEWVIAVRDAPKPPPTRLSLGPAALAAAENVWFVAFGAEKAAAIRAARHDVRSPLPAAIVARHARSVRWFLDADAQATGASAGP